MPIDPKTIKWDEPAPGPAPDAITWDEPGKLTSVAAGIGKGVGSTALGLQKLVGQGIEKLGGIGSETKPTDLVVKPTPNFVQRAGQWLINDADTGREKLKNELAPYKAANPISAGGGELAGEIAATLPVGGVLAKGAQALGAAPTVVRALQTSGMTTGAKVAPGVLPALQNFATRVGAGAATGGASGVLVDQDSAGKAAALGGAMPVVGNVLAAAGRSTAGVLKPFFKAGQESIARKVLTDFAQNPDEALHALRRSQEFIPGSAPTTAAASGDIGLAGLSRTMQSADPALAAEMATRQATQNTARTAAMEAVAGNPGKLAAAKAARDDATGYLREAALDAAGDVDANRVVKSIDSMLKYPENAGRLAQQALSGIRSQIAGASQDGVINARALYAIRKDINDILDGKLQGEAGNLRYASGQLIKVRDMFDNAIDQASRNVQAGKGTQVTLNGGVVAPPGVTSSGPRANWRQYLDEYKRQSVPINQMEILSDVLNRVQTGTTDANGNYVLSAVKLNNIMKNEGQDLMKKLSPEQLQLIRNLAADLDASQVASNAGKATGSNTVQNLAGANLLQSTLGQAAGGHPAISATLGRVLELPYGAANRQIKQKLSEALLDPKEAARLMSPKDLGRIAKAIEAANAAGLNQIPYRAAPLAVNQN